MTHDEQEKRISKAMQRVIEGGEIGEALLLMAGRLALFQAPEADDEILTFMSLELIADIFDDLEQLKKSGAKRAPGQFETRLAEQLAVAMKG